MLREHQDVPDRAGAVALIDSWAGVPAFAHDKHLSVFAANGLATALLPIFAVEVNLARAAFLDRTLERTGIDWDDASEQVASSLRATLASYGEDEEYVEVVGELAALSPDFATVWARSVPAPTRGTFPFRVDRFGVMTLTYQQLLIPGDRGDVLVVWRPADDHSAKRLAALAQSLVD
ncbi:hypothetical protein NVV95_06485 [Herbiconiux sp. CPCC 205716]|uniref:MmyB-like transcription regulator ligand binding domain-containing protein n=1 Tax=Herbiconiux gentiana TaxID=2970912 RepID=A0ABT2GDC6_9MICO|nr:hypothetical protein [Herbiconiux gentiana]MCS5714198.1 hypothetical protein [Herbiconiux gentiana]